MRSITTLKRFGYIFLLTTLYACSETPSVNQETISSASWNQSEKVLLVSGTSSNVSKEITIKDDISRTVVGTSNVDKNQQWNLNLYNPSLIPCKVRVGQLTVNVKDTPSDCSLQRVSPVQVQVTNSKSIASILPDTKIVTPTEDTTVIAGQTLAFSGLSSKSGARFQWDFAGLANNLTVQNPGDIKLNTIGSFRVKLSSIDENGIADPTPDERVITVLPNASQKRAFDTVPVASIATPSTNKLVNVGDSIYFAAVAPPAGEVYTYEWDFGGANAISSQQIPGVVTFWNAGTYTVNLNVVDSLGVRSTLADTRLITVNAPVGINQAPTGNITQPLTDMTINVGDVLNFTGAVIDPNNNGPYTFLWQFAGAAAESTLLNPGIVMFNQAGIYPVSFFVTDAAGVTDPNPPFRLITVNSVGAVNNDFPDGVITSPMGDMNILVGDMVDFTGLGESLTGNVPLMFNWMFDGAAPPSDLESPGLIPFDMAGVYTVTFTVTDSLGQVDPSPATVVITVTDPAAPPPADDDPAAPESTILTPAGDITIMVGESLTFQGEGVSPVGAEPLTFAWKFDDAMPETSMDQMTAPILFDHPDVYTITLTVTDANGVSDPTPAMIKVTAELPPEPPASTAPMGNILMPDEDVTIMVGESVDFNGLGVSPAGLEPLIYLWNFGGGAPDFEGAMPGLVPFNMAGVFTVSLLVVDSTGVPDPNPPSVTITVIDPAEPIAQILNPPEDITIEQGMAIEFIGEGFSPVGAEPLMYMWDFGGLAPAVADPIGGLILFDMPGVYEIILHVTDANGVMDSTPASVIITVEPVNPAPVDPGPDPVIAATPDADMLSPATKSIVISVGDSIEFIGEPEYVDLATASFLWDFGGAIPNVNAISPGFVTFDMEGIYNVTFIVTNAEGVSDPNPPTVEVIVEPLL